MGHDPPHHHRHQANRARYAQLFEEIPLPKLSFKSTGALDAFYRSNRLRR